MTDGSSLPLTAPVRDSTTWHTGTGTLDYALTATRNFHQGDLLGAGMNGGAAALSALGAVSDPLAFLMSAGVGWCMEHVQPLRAALDWLAGKPDVIASFAETWEDIGERLCRIGDDLADLVRRDAAAWNSAAASAYQTLALDQAMHVKAAGVAAGGIGTATSLAGVMVAVTRATVRDLVAEAVGAIISKALQAAALVTIPKVVAEISVIVAEWMARILARIRELLAAIARLTNTVNQLAPVFAAVERAAIVKGAHPRLVANLTAVTPRQTRMELLPSADEVGRTIGIIAGTNTVTTVTNPSHVGVNLDPARGGDGRPIAELDL